MLKERFLQARTDRIIALARLGIAIFAFGAVWFDPAQPTTMPMVTYAALAAYSLFAAAAAVALQGHVGWSNRLAVVSHLVDIGVFTFLVYSTEGPTSPFFLLFTFAIVSATFRWRWRGALWTSVAVLALLLASAAASVQIAPTLPFETDRFLIRISHITVIGAMLVYFGFYQQRLADEMSLLTAWQPDPLATTEPLEFLQRCTAHAADVFSAPCILLVLGDPEEPQLTACYWERGTFRRDTLDLARFAELVPPPLAVASILQIPQAKEALVLAEHDQIQVWRGEVVNPALRETYAIGHALSAPIVSERATGRLFVVDGPDQSIEELMLIGIVAGQIGAGLNRREAFDALRVSSAAEERLRLARDLHDGVLQTLAGTALQLQNLANLAEREPKAMASRIHVLQDWLLAEQRELRELIQRLRPGYLFASANRPDLVALAESLQRQWGVAIEISGDPADLRLPIELLFHVSQIIREAVANAARHGGASKLVIGLATSGHELEVRIADNGHGLPSRGTFSHSECAQLKIGPRSLRERVVGLGGSLLLHSGTAGLILDVRIPVTEAERG